MKCKCKAKPSPTVTWFKDTAKVKEGGRFKMTSNHIDDETHEIILEIKVRYVKVNF